MPGGGFVVLLAAGGGYGILGAIYRFDANGNIVWTKSIAGTDWIGMSGMKLLSDGGFLIMGQSSVSVNEQMSLERLDAAGNFIWQHRYAYDADDLGFFSDAVESGGQLYVVGWYATQTPVPNQYPNYVGNDYGVLANIDLGTGNMSWLKTYPSPSKSWYPTRINLYNGGLLISGIADSVNNGNHSGSMVLVEVNLDGSPRNAKLLWLGGDVGISTIRTIVQPDNSVYRLCIPALHPIRLVFRVGFRRRSICGSTSKKMFSGQKILAGSRPGGRMMPRRRLTAEWRSPR